MPELYCLMQSDAEEAGVVNTPRFTEKRIKVRNLI